MNIEALIESNGLYMTTLPTGEKFTWRLLTMKEYRVFDGLRQADIYMAPVLYEMVFSRCYVGEADAINGNLPAGYFPSIGELIMWLSGDGGVSNERNEIEAAREAYSADSVLETMKRIVLIAFSSYDPDVIDTWTRPELLKKFTLAEAVLVNKGGYEPLDTKKIMSAEQAAKKKASPVDFRKENQEYSQAMGDPNKPHPLDQHPLDLARKQAKTNKLMKSQAKELDKLAKRGR